MKIFFCRDGNFGMAVMVWVIFGFVAYLRVYLNMIGPLGATISVV